MTRVIIKFLQALYFHSSLNDVTCIAAIEIIALGRSTHLACKDLLNKINLVWLVSTEYVIVHVIDENATELFVARYF